jgi:hypothetical protein
VFKEGTSMGKYEQDTIITLIGRFVSLARRFLKLEKAYVKEAGNKAMKTGLPVLALGGACLVLMALAGVFGLVTVVLLLNTWFTPWASALIVTLSLMLTGVLLGGAAMLMAKKGAKDAKLHLHSIQEDMRWLKKS